MLIHISYFQPSHTMHPAKYKKDETLKHIKNEIEIVTGLGCHIVVLVQTYNCATAICYTSKQVCTCCTLKSYAQNMSFKINCADVGISVRKIISELLTNRTYYAVYPSVFDSTHSPLVQY